MDCLFLHESETLLLRTQPDRIPGRERHRRVWFQFVPAVNKCAVRGAKVGNYDGGAIHLEPAVTVADTMRIPWKRNGAARIAPGNDGPADRNVFSAIKTGCAFQVKRG